MKALLPLKLILLFICHASCTERENKTSASAGTVTNKPAIASPSIVKDTFETAKLISPVTCIADTTQSYALYIPATRQAGTMPVIYFFDPHGDGTLPLNKYYKLAEKYHFILVGSNNSKNGNDFSTSERVWNNLYNDTKKRLPIDLTRIYACGFSGGAKVAGYIALNHPEVKTIITNGAGLPDATQPDNFHFGITAIAGKGDMNMSDLVIFNAALDKTQTNHSIIFFDGKHEWAPENTMNKAFAGLQFEAMRGHLIPSDNILLNSYSKDARNKISSYLKADNYLRADEECRLSINQLQDLVTEINWFKEKELAIENNIHYQRQRELNQNLLATEQNIKEQYRQKFQQADMNYWTATIRDLQLKAKPLTDEGAMHQRLIAYLSLAFFSISNQLVTNHRDQEARYFVDLYKLDDATNTEAWYLSAILHARNNDPGRAKEDLLKAIYLGFTDRIRLEQQPEFKSLPMNITEIERKMNH
jgi:predicted esterase